MVLGNKYYNSYLCYEDTNNTIRSNVKLKYNTFQLWV